ncbi:MAG TPA: NlpC/P60 family protein [Streptosporangiaceae bacterium]
MRAPLSVRKSATSPVRPATPRWRRGWLLGLSFATVVAVAGIGGSAVALPQPTVTQVKARLAALNAKSARLGQQYDQVLQQLSAANQRLKVLNKETARYRVTFDRMRAQIGRLAAVAYEEGGANSPVALLTSESPQQVLDQSSILTELSVANASQISQYRSASRQLLNAQAAAARARASVLPLKRSLAKRIAVLKKLEAQQSALLAQLTPAQQTGTGPGGGGGSNGGGGPPGPAGSAAGKAVAFAEAQIGCPYVYGATGPCNSGFDCSGLMMASWGYAGVSIPRVSYDQMGSLPAVPLHNSAGNFTTAYLEPGDILGFAGNSHVGMYVGGGMLVDAPVPGQNVEKVALSGWYLSNLDGAVRP